MSETFGRSNVEIRGDWSGLNQDIDKAASAISDKFAAAGATMTSVGKSLTLGITAPLTAIGAVAMTSGINYENAMKKIAVSTGASGDELQALGDNARNIFRTMPVDIEDAASVVGELNTRLGATGAELEAVSRDVLTFARVFELDAAPAAALLGKTLNALDMDASQASVAMDMFTRGAQLSGLSVEDMMNYIIDAGPAFDTLGFGLEESIALFASFEAAGARPEEVIQSLTFAMNSMVDQGLEPSAESFQLLINQIKEAESETEALTLANDLFGRRVGGKVMEDIRAGRFEIEAWTEEIRNSSGALDQAGDATMGFNENLKILRNRASDSLQPVGNAMIDVANSALDRLTPAIDGVTGAIGDMSPAALNATVVIGGMAAAVGPALLVLGQMATSVSSLTKLLGTMSGALNITTGALIAKTAAAGGLLVILGLVTYAMIEQASARQDLLDDTVDIRDETVRTTSSFAEYQEQTEELREQIDNLAGVTGGYGIHLADAMDKTISMTEEQYNYERAMIGVNDAIEEGIGYFGDLSGVLPGATSSTDRMADAMDRLGDEAETGWQQIDSVKKHLEMLDGYMAVASLRVEVHETWTSDQPHWSQFTGPAVGTGTPSGKKAPITPPAQSLPPTMKWSGGPVIPDNTYLVGERGIELFAPSVPGNIISNHELRQMMGQQQQQPQVVNKYYMTANYPMQSELDVVQKLRVEEALNA